MPFIGEFDTSNVDPNYFSPVPEDWYKVTIKNCELKTTKTGGKMLSWRFDILGGKYNNRVLFSNMNIINQSEAAVQIALADLAAIKIATGKPNCKNTDEMIGKMIEVKVTVKSDRNEIKGYRAIEGSKIPMPAEEPSQKKESQESSEGWESSIF